MFFLSQPQPVPSVTADNDCNMYILFLIILVKEKVDFNQSILPQFIHKYLTVDNGYSHASL